MCDNLQDDNIIHFFSSLISSLIVLFLFKFFFFKLQLLNLIVFVPSKNLGLTKVL